MVTHLYTDFSKKNRNAGASPFPKLLHLLMSKELFIISIEGNGDFGRPHYPRRKLIQDDLQVAQAIPYLR